VSRELRRLIAGAGTASILLASAITTIASTAPPPGDPGVGNVPQNRQADTTYAASYKTHGVTNVFVTSQQLSCFRPEVPANFYNGPNNGYTGLTGCQTSTTGEDTGATQYPTQFGTSTAAGPMRVTDHSESDIRVDPTNPRHIIGSSKWFTGAEGYNHLLGFYESFDTGKTWKFMGHIPGYEGWTDNTDPVGAFDPFGNYYEAILPYQFFYDATGHKKYEVGNEPNPFVANEAVSVAVRPENATSVSDWISTHNGKPDYVFTTNAGFGQEPDKQWIAIDRNPSSPFYGRAYVSFVNFNGHGSKPYISSATTYQDGTHTDWSTPTPLPSPNMASNNNTYLYPHVDPDGVVYTPIVNYVSASGSCCVDIYIDYSTNGGATWIGPKLAVAGVHTAPLTGPGYSNTTFEDGIEETFGVGKGAIYLAYETKSTGYGNILLTASYDKGETWTPPIQVNDNASPVDEFQPNLAVGPDGTVSVNFYDRRLPCPSSDPSNNVGLSLDGKNPNYSGSMPPFGATNYCITSAVQFYRSINSKLSPLGSNIRLTEHVWDPQLNAPDRSCPCNQDDTFLGDYFGNDISGGTDFASFVSTYDDGTNPNHYQQQVVATISVP